MNLRRLLAVLTLFVSALNYAQTSNGTCLTASGFCTATGYTYSAGVNTGTGQVGPDYGCLLTQPNPAWFFLELSTSGNLDIEISNSNNEDLDFILWGPFADASSPCTALLTAGNTEDCSYSSTATEQANIIGGNAGEFYMLLVTNFSNNPTDISMVSLPSSTATTNCTVACPTVDFGQWNGASTDPLPSTINCTDPAITLAADENGLNPAVAISPCINIKVFPVSSNGTLTIDYYEGGTLIGSDSPPANSNFTGDISFADPTATHSFVLDEGTAGGGNMTYAVFDCHTNTLLATGTWVDDGSPQTVTITPPPNLSGTATYTILPVTGNPGLTSNNNGTATFDPSLVPGGTYDITYSWNDGNGVCSGTATHSITVANGADASFSYSLATYCQSDADPTPTITGDTGGTFSSTAGLSLNTSTGQIDVSASTAGTYTVTYNVGSGGCTASSGTSVTIAASTAGTDVVTACDSYTWIDGMTYTASNTTATHTLSNAAGCDSVVTLNLTLNNSTAATDVITACDSYTWIDGMTYTTSNNTATHTLTNAAGCDSVITLDLTINNSTASTDVITACGSYTWIDGMTYTTSNNTATHTLTNAAGCDSVITLDLTINTSVTTTDVITACDSYTWIDGITYTASNNTAADTLTTASGCDSIINLDLTINYSTTATDVITACDSYTWIDGMTYTASNSTATHLLTNAAGCDSLVTLDLTINYSTTATDVITACDSYTWIDGMTYTASNTTATHLLTNAAGCDSLVTLDLTINYSTTATDVITACDSYTWIDGMTYTASNSTATHLLTNAAGCDSLVTLDLTINYSTTATDVITACDSYTWIDGMTYTASNTTATHLLTNAAGCDSLVTLDLTINYSTTATDVITACDSYTWIDGMTYTASNSTATHLLTNAAGCDSLVTLDLTINYSTTATDVITACDSYTWIDGMTYTASNNTATYLLSTVNGCDSLVTLDLTVNYSNSGTDVVTACNSYTWIDGITYTASNNTATHTLTNASGCDSLVTLDLTVNYSSTGTDVITACDSYTWIDGITYTASNNTATHLISTGSGCDSLVTLNLTIGNANVSFSVTKCQEYTVPSGNATYYTSGIYYDTLTTITGCDSILTIDASINTVDTSVTQNGTQLTANSSSPNIQWLDCNTGLIMNGFSGPVFNAPYNGSFAAVVYENNCSESSSCYDINTVSLEEAIYGQGISVYPNPTHDGQFTISHQEPLLSVEVIDMAGKIISLDFNQETGNVNGAQLAAGAYSMRIQTTTGNMYMARVVVLR